MDPAICSPRRIGSCEGGCSQEKAAAAAASASPGVGGGGGRSTIPPLHPVLHSMAAAAPIRQNSISQGYKFGSEKASALNTYAVMKSGGGTRPGARIDTGCGDLGGQGAPPPAATCTASPIPGVHTSTLVSSNSQT